MKRLTLSLAVLCATLSTPAPLRAQLGGFDHSRFDTILQQTVNDGRVDYQAIRHQHLRALEQYLNSLAQADVSGLPRQEQLAFYINLYNATVIRLVIARYHSGYSPSDSGFSLFVEPLVRLKGRTISLNDLENKVIRPTFNDPRIHVALVCAARSCPPLLPRAYRGDDLDRVLEANMRRFLTDVTNNRVDHTTKKLRLSQIFEWYADDFGGKARLAEYVSRYRPDSVAGYSVVFIPYSWELNDVGG